MKNLKQLLALVGAELRIKELEAEIADRRNQIVEIKAAVAEVPMEPEATQRKTRKKPGPKTTKQKSEQGRKPGKKKPGPKKGWKHTEEARAKMSKSHKARLAAEKTKKK